MSEVIIVKNEAEAGAIYGRAVADLIKAKPNAVLGLATGSSPLAAYQALAQIVKDEHVDVSHVRGFALDEYLGIPLDHPQSYHSTIHRTVVEPLGLNPALVHVPGDSLARHFWTANASHKRDRPTTRRLQLLAASTCRFSGSAPTAMSDSTSQARRSPPEPESRHWWNRPESIMRASSTTTSTRCRRIA